MVLYKYLEPQHAERMVCGGTVRIGTLLGYRGLEGNDPERGDAGEGELLLHSDATRRVYNSTDELPPVLRSMSIACGPGGIATEGETAVVLTFDGPDMFVYCVSETYEQTSLRGWGGSCVRIDEPVLFFQALDAGLREEMEHRGRRIGAQQFGRCSYVDRHHNWHAKLPAHRLLKPLRYKHQREVRAGWTVEDGDPLDAVLISSPAIAAACAIHVPGEVK